mmetsp:Transcript_43779/g.52955  ORF Transcript_43779/g.52955 Transcript_43779/m.52955 type:complete len:317 (+) Transcript_43779:15-965(+)
MGALPPSETRVPRALVYNQVPKTYDSALASVRQRKQAQDAQHAQYQQELRVNPLEKNSVFHVLNHGRDLPPISNLPHSVQKPNQKVYDEGTVAGLYTSGKSEAKNNKALQQKSDVQDIFSDRSVKTYAQAPNLQAGLKLTLKPVPSSQISALCMTNKRAGNDNKFRSVHTRSNYFGDVEGVGDPITRNLKKEEAFRGPERVVLVERERRAHPEGKAPSIASYLGHMNHRIQTSNNVPMNHPQTRTPPGAHRYNARQIQLEAIKAGNQMNARAIPQNPPPGGPKGGPLSVFARSSIQFDAAEKVVTIPSSRPAFGQY